VETSAVVHAMGGGVEALAVIRRHDREFMNQW
jgi:hypothetical protein